MANSERVQRNLFEDVEATPIALLNADDIFESIVRNPDPEEGPNRFSGPRDPVEGCRPQS